MIDPRIPMMVQQPNVLAALDAGTTAATNQNALMRQAEGQNIFRQFGADAMGGDRNALAQIAGFDPVMAQGMQSERLNQQATGLRMELTREHIAQARREAAAAASSVEDARLAKEELERGKGYMRFLGQAFLTGDQDTWDVVTSELGVSGIPMNESGLQFVDGILTGFEEGLSGIVPQQPDSSAAEEKIQRLMETRLPDGRNLSREEAIGIADGRYQITQLGELMDKATGQIIDPSSMPGQLPLGVTPAPVTPVTAELPPGPRQALPSDSVDYRGAFGAEGLVTNLVNGLTDFATGQRAFEEQGRARTALTNLRTRTLTTLASASVAGRPSNYVMQMFEQNVAQPTLTGGPAAALDTAQQTMDFLDAMIAENQAVLNSRVDAGTRSTARRSIEALEGLRQDYEIVVEGLSPQRQPVADGAPMPAEAARHPVLSSVAERAGVTVEEMWQLMTPEERAKFGFSAAPAPAAPARTPSAQELRRGAQ